MINQRFYCPPICFRHTEANDSGEEPDGKDYDTPRLFWIEEAYRATLLNETDDEQ